MITKISFISALLLSILTFSQDFKPFEMKRLEKFGYDLNDKAQRTPDFSQLTAILEVDQRRRTSRTFGYIFAGLGAFTTTAGINGYNKTKGTENGIGEFVTTVFIAVGISELGASIPFFLAAKKRKRNRDALMQEYKME